MLLHVLGKMAAVKDVEIFPVLTVCEGSWLQQLAGGRPLVLRAHGWPALAALDRSIKT